MRTTLLLAYLLLVPGKLFAIPLSCQGTDPNWSLDLKDDIAAYFEYERGAGYEIPQSSIAEGRDWPRAFTLIAEYDTAIALIDKQTCLQNGQSYQYSAYVLTQRGQTPILLKGCCEDPR